MHHIYSCESINNIKPETSYDEIYNGKLKNQIYILKRMKNKLGLSCAKLRPALASCPLAPVQASYPLRLSTLLTELAPAEK